MNFGVVSIFPEMILDNVKYGILGKAVANNQVKVSCWNPRDFTDDKHRTVDDKPYGGGPGMLMKVKPLRLAIGQAKLALGDKSRVFYLSPQGNVLNQKRIIGMSQLNTMILVAGRYEGIDQRVLEQDIDEEISIGDYIISGGELAIMVLIDAISRLLPNVLGDNLSAMQDSFMQGLLDYPHYTRPVDVDGMSVPAVLLSGHHQEIEKWRMKQALGTTWEKKPELLMQYQLSETQKILLEQYKLENGKGNNE